MISIQITMDERTVHMVDEGRDNGTTWVDMSEMFFGGLKALGYSFLFEPTEVLTSARDDAIRDKYGEEVLAMTTNARRGEDESDK